MALDMYDPVQEARGLRRLVAEHADRSEAQRHLAGEVASAFAQSGLYRVAAPRDCFGSECDPRTQLAVIETIAQVDASAAWNLMIGIESFGLIAPAFGDCLPMIEDPAVILASSTAAVGKAVKVERGYVVDGQWQFVSGVHNAQNFWRHGAGVAG